jgi:hypothetical protein
MTGRTIAITGEIGVGKTHQILRAFPDHRYLCTDEAGLKRAAAGTNVAVPPKKRLKIFHRWDGQYDDAGLPKVTKPLTEFRKSICRWEEGCRSGKIKEPGLVISEFTTIMEWSYAQLREQIGTKGRARFDLSAACLDCCEWISTVAKRTGRDIILDAHWRGPTYVGEDASKQSGAPRGIVKWPGGIAFPEGRPIKGASKHMDAIWQLCVDFDEDMGEVTRYFLTQPGENAVRKAGGFGIEPREIVDDENNLASLLEKIKWE